MDKNIYSLPINFEVTDEVETNDSRFLKVTIDVLHTGENYNGSVFTKEVVDENIETIKNTPILGFIRQLPFGEKDFKGHEYVLTKTENGIERKYVGSAYGVIPESCNPRWIIKEDDIGEEREYLQVDAVMWTKFKDSTEIMKRDFSKGQSMEIDPNSVEGYEDEDTELFHFTKFSFDGCCVLGSNVNPAMSNANITLNDDVQFSVSEFVRHIQFELNNKYSEFTRIVEKQSTEESKIDFAENDTTDESYENNSEEQDENTKEGGNVTMATDFTQTVMQQFSDIAKVVSEYATTKNYWGDDVPRYYAVDVQDAEVIMVDRQENYQYYGCAFTMDGDKPVIDFESIKRKKITYADYVDGEIAPEGAFDFGNHISEIEETAFSKVKEADEKVTKAEEDKTTAESNFTSLQEKYDEIKPKYEEYVKAENERIEAENKENKNKLIAQYEVHLKDNEEFVDLKEKINDYSIEEIESKCAIMFARKNIATNFSVEGKSNSTVLGVDSGEDSVPDGYVKTKYGLIRTKR